MLTKPDILASDREEFRFKTHSSQPVQSFSQNVLSRLLSWAPANAEYHNDSSNSYNSQNQ
jgi:hypothetical protein